MFFVQTPRLLLRKVREEDYPYFQNYLMDKCCADILQSITRGSAIKWQGGTAATGGQGGKRKQCKGERFYG